MAQRRPHKAQFPRRISRRPYTPFCKVRVRFGLLSLLRRVRWIALGALCAKGLWCSNASARQANAAIVPLMRSLRQYINVMFDALALCEHTECRMPTDRMLVFSNFNRTLGSGELATGQETLPIRVLGSARFFCFPFFSKSLSLPRGDTKNATRKATEPPFAF